MQKGKSMGARASVAAIMAMLGCLPAVAQVWPDRPVTIIVPSAPGDGSDIIARLLAERLRGRLGQSVVVDNRLGAGGVVGTNAAARAAPDGYTFVMGNAGSHGINAAIFQNIPYDVLRDFQPISLLYRAPNIFLAAKKTPATTLQKLIAHAKAAPSPLSYASGGNGSSAHMNAEYLKVLTGVAANHVPYRGSGPALNDLVSGQIDFMAVNLPPAIGLVQSGQVTPLAVTTLKRSPALPDVPTVDESGFKGYETVAWFGLFAPKGVPASVVERLMAEIGPFCAEPETNDKLKALGGELVCNTPAQFEAFVEADIARWKDVAQRGNIRISAQ